MSEAISMLRPACGKNLLLSVHMLAAYEYGRVNLKEQTGEIGGHDERAVMGRRRRIGRGGACRNFFAGIVTLDRCVQGVMLGQSARQWFNKRCLAQSDSRRAPRGTNRLRA